MYLSGKHNDSHEFYAQGLIQSEKIQNRWLTALFHNRIGFIYYWQSDYNSSLKHYRQVFEIYKEENKIPDSLAVLEAYAIYNYILKFHLDTIPVELPNNELLSVPSPSNPVRLIKHNYLYCLHYLTTHNYSQYRHYSDENEKLLHKHSIGKIWPYMVYLQKAKYYNSIHEYELSLKYYEELYEKACNETELTPYLFHVFRNLLSTYNYLDEIDKSLKLIDTYQRYLKDWNSPYFYVDYITIGNIYLTKGDVKNAQIAYLTSLNILKSYHISDNRLARVYCNLGYLHDNNMSQPDSMLYYMHKAEAILIEYPDLCLENYVAFYLGYYYYIQSQYALSIMQMNFILDDVSRIVNDHEYFLQHYTNLIRTNYLDALFTRANSFFNLSEQKGYDSIALVSSCQDYASLIHLKENLYDLQDYEKSRISKLKDIRMRHEEYFNIEYTHYKQTGNTELIKKLIQISENSKAYMLKDYLTSEFSKRMADLPDEVIDQARALQKEIDSMQYAINKVKSYSDNQHDQLFIHTLLDKIEQYNNFEQQLKSEYINYANIKLEYKKPSVSIPEIQEQLKPDQALIEYMIARHACYSFYIDKDTFCISHTDIEDDFIQEIHQFRKHFDNHHYGNFTPTYIKKYITDANKLYKIFFKPHEHLIGSKHIIIIPDYNLYYIPFEALITKPVDSIKELSFTHLPYLIHNNPISYLYSSEQLFEGKRTSKSMCSFAGFAPDYTTDKTSSTYISLPGAKEEIMSASNYYRGKTHTKNPIRKEDFFNACEKYDIVHLAMHAVVDTNEAMNSSLIFQPYQATSKQLHAYEVYANKINSSLVVLSACNTGKGKVIAGEGVFSITRAFLLAGVPNVIYTQWSVTDQSSKHLMNKFYSYLSEGKPTSIALQEAKIHYLQTADPVKTHPYYWAGYIQIGSPIILPSGQNTYRIIIGGVLLLIVILIVLFYRNRTKS